MSSKRSRRSSTSEQKAAILRRHLTDKVPVSDLCDEYNLQPACRRPDRTGPRPLHG
jgi:transposase-like protein